MQFSQLEYLNALFREGSFSGAAEKLGLTQPALSIQIQKLEEEFGVTLIDRRNRPIRLTEEGHIFYEKSLEILRLAEQLKQISYDMSEEVQGLITVGIIPTVAPYLVPLFIHDLYLDFPMLKVEVTELKTEDIVSGIRQGKLDCGILSTPVEASGVTFLPVFYEKFFIYIAENHPLFSREKISVKDIDESDIWYLEEGNCFQNQINSICRIRRSADSPQNLVYRSNSIESLRRIVENKNGITFIPELATINIPPEQEDLIREFSDEQPFREISIVLPEAYPRIKQVKALQKVLTKSIPSRMTARPEGWIVDTALHI